MITFDDYDLTEYVTELKYYPRKVTGSTRDNQVTVPGRHGVYSFDTEQKALEIEFEAYCDTESMATLWALLDQLKVILDPLKGEKNLYVFADRYWPAKRVGDFDLERFHCSGIIRWTMLCSDPHAYAVEETDSEHTIAESPAAVYEQTGGTAYINPVYIITPDVEISGITLANVTTDEEITWEGTVGGGGGGYYADYSKLRIDTEHFLIEAWDGDEWVVVMDGYTGGTFPRLRPDYNNHLIITGMESGTLEIVYRDRYL